MALTTRIGCSTSLRPGEAADTCFALQAQRCRNAAFVITAMTESWHISSAASSRIAQSTSVPLVSVSRSATAGAAERKGSCSRPSNPAALAAAELACTGLNLFSGGKIDSVGAPPEIGRFSFSQRAKRFISLKAKPRGTIPAERHTSIGAR